MINLLYAFLLFLQVQAAPGEISGEISLAKNLTLKPGGVLFVIAKKPGVPMPAAVVRIAEPKFPQKFSLSAKNAMAPGSPFDGPFVVTARYSPSGDAMDKSGNEGSIPNPVAVGAANVKIELKP